MAIQSVRKRGSAARKTAKTTKKMTRSRHVSNKKNDDIEHEDESGFDPQYVLGFDAGFAEGFEEGHRLAYEKQE